MNASETTSLTLRLPKALRERIKRAAAAEDRNESQFVRLHLAKLLESNGAKKPRKPKHAA